MSNWSDIRPHTPLPRLGGAGVDASNEPCGSAATASDADDYGCCQHRDECAPGVGCYSPGEGNS